MKTNGKRTCYYSILTTALLVGLYWLGYFIILPGVDSAYFSSISKIAASRSNVSVFTLGYLPFLNGFIIVEIFSLIVPFGRRMRCGGSAGRAKLNRTAMITSVVLCIIQSQAIALAMERAVVLEGILLVPTAGWLFRLSTCVTLTAGAILIFYIAKLISWRGIANGFCILIAIDILNPIVRHSASGLNSFEKIEPLYWLKYFCVIAVAFLLLFYYYQRRVGTTATTAAPRNRVNFDLPSFPQGVLPLVWAFSVFSLPSVVRELWSPALRVQPPGFWHLLIGTTVLIVVFSAIGVVMFSSRKRITQNLPYGVHLGDDSGRLLRNQSIRGAAVLAGGSAVLLTIERLLGWGPMPKYAGLIFLFAIALDVIEQWKFSWKHRRTVELIELDNPHLASYLKSVLESSGVDTVVQTYHYRRLLFFFGPLTKMRMLVASEDVEHARNLIDLKSIQKI